MSTALDHRRALQGISPGVLTGLAIPYITPTVIRTPFGNFREAIAPGALDSALSGTHGAAVAFLRDHESARLLGRRRAGTLELTKTLAGLRMRSTLPGTEEGRDAFEAARRGDLTGMSFAFTLGDDGDVWHDGDGGLPLRMIHKVERLFEVSAVAFPAYESTTLDTLERSRHPLKVRALVSQERMALTGGHVRPGRRVRPPSELATWCRRYRWRVGTRAATWGPAP